MYGSPARVENRDAVVALVDVALADVPLAELLPRLAELGIPAGEVRTLDRVYGWEQTRSQGPRHRRRPPGARVDRDPRAPIRLDDNVFAGGRETHTHPPLLGEHTESVLAWLDAAE